MCVPEQISTLAAETDPSGDLRETVGDCRRGGREDEKEGKREGEEMEGRGGGGQRGPCGPPRHIH